jgi:hypothetical protein
MRAGQAAMSYDRFCRLYADYANVTGAACRVGHKANAVNLALMWL